MRPAAIDGGSIFALPDDHMPASGYNGRPHRFSFCRRIADPGGFDAAPSKLLRSNLRDPPTWQQPRI
jgi:hypothetical protein